MPHLIDYYFGKGVDRIFLIDNQSTDSTVSVALQHENVHVFSTSDTFKRYSNWLEILLDRYGKDHWCLAVDVDEVFRYPGCESASIRRLCDFLERQGDTAVYCVLLDMYSDKAIAQNSYQPGQNPLEVCPYFDPHFEAGEVEWVNRRTMKPYRTLRFSGNMRKRVFDADVNLTKVPLFKYEKGVFVARGVHAIDGARASEIQGAVMHFKYLQDFNARVVDEAARGQHEGGAAAYQKYAARVEEGDTLNLYGDVSLRYQSDKQLLELGIMATLPEWESYVAEYSAS